MSNDDSRDAQKTHPYGPGSHGPLESAREMPACYPIKGNIRDDGRQYYHRPDSRNYGATKPEVWFDSPSSAEEAGFVASPSHPDGTDGANYEPGGSAHPCSAADVEANRTAAAAVVGAVTDAGTDTGTGTDADADAGTETETETETDGDDLIAAGESVHNADLHPYGVGSHALMSKPAEMPRFYPIKGNLRKDGSRLYHRPDSDGYRSTRPEVWFDSPSAAEASGFELSPTHPDGSTGADYEPGGQKHGWTFDDVRSARLDAWSGSEVESGGSGADDDSSLAGAALAGATGVAAGVGVSRLAGSADADADVDPHDADTEVAAAEADTEVAAAEADTEAAAAEADTEAAAAEADTEVAAAGSQAGGEAGGSDEASSKGSGRLGAAAVGGAALAGKGLKGNGAADKIELESQTAEAPASSAKVTGSREVGVTAATSAATGASSGAGATTAPTVERSAAGGLAGAGSTNGGSDLGRLLWIGLGALALLILLGLLLSQCGGDEDVDSVASSDSEASGTTTDDDVSSSAAAGDSDSTAGSDGDSTAGSDGGSDDSDDADSEQAASPTTAEQTTSTEQEPTAEEAEAAEEAKAAEEAQAAEEAKAAEEATFEAAALAALNDVGITGLSVEVDDDTVRLLGDVGSESEREAAIETIEGIDLMGSRVVENAMVVAAADDESPADEDAVDEDPAYNG